MGVEAVITKPLVTGQPRVENINENGLVNNMKIKYTTNNQRLNVEINTDSVKEAFKELSIFQEVFDEDCCQLCNNVDLQFVVRTVDGNDFYELKCKKCFAKLAYGQHKTGNSLFPKRKNAEGVYDKNKGWHKWGEQNV